MKMMRVYLKIRKILIGAALFLLCLGLLSYLIISLSNAEMTDPYGFERNRYNVTPER